MSRNRAFIHSSTELPQGWQGREGLVGGAWKRGEKAGRTVRWREGLVELLGLFWMQNSRSRLKFVGVQVLLSAGHLRVPGSLLPLEFTGNDI